jgi:hypothetical protein
LIVGTKRNRIESDHQTAFFSWVRLNQQKHAELKRFYAIPNGGKRGHSTAIALYLEGVRAGVLDVHLPLARQGKAGLWFEFKAPDGTLSPQQREEVLALEAEGHAVYIIREWTTAAAITRDYLSLPELQIPAALAAVDDQHKDRRRAR